MGLKIFFFGLGSCAEALVRRSPGLEPAAPPAVRRRVDALRAAGVEAYAFDGTKASPGLEAAHQARRGGRRLRSARRARTARRSRRGDRRRAKARAHGLFLDRRRLRRAGWQLGGRDARDARPARRGASPGIADEARWTEAARGEGASRPTSCACRESTAPAATRSNGLRRRRRAADRQARPRHQSRPCRRHRRVDPARPPERNRGPGLERRRRRARPAAGRDRLSRRDFSEIPPPPEEPFETAGLSPIAASFYDESKRVSNARAKAQLGFKPALSDLPGRPDGRYSRRARGGGAAAFWAARAGNLDGPGLM